MTPAVLVLGSGPIRIGQGIEFDYSCVHCVWALRELGYRAVIMNNNPETVSTDFDTGDGLYFEPVTLEDVLDVVAQEKPIGVVVQFGGQTAINLAQDLEEAGITILGTAPSAIAAAEDRHQFERLLQRLEIPKPAGKAVHSLDEARRVAHEIGYPVLVRPSFVLGGRAMEIVYEESHLEAFYGEAEAANPGQPVLVDRYLQGVEAEVDVISDGQATFVPGIMEHIERAGVHSGDSMAVYPPVGLSADVQRQIVLIACRVARALGVKGLMNIQFVIQNEVAYVLEVNPRASRTAPYLSKVTGIPMVRLATRCSMGETLAELGYGSGLWTLSHERNEPIEGPCPPAAKGFVQSEGDLAAGRIELPQPPLYAVKAPVFSFQKLARVEPSLGPEMKSTGEVLGIDRAFGPALYKAMVASGITFKPQGHVILTVTDGDKPMAVDIARRFDQMGYSIAATGGTHDELSKAGLEALRVCKLSQGSPNILDLLSQGDVSLMINTPHARHGAEADASRIRRACIEMGVACVTSIDTARALASALEYFGDSSAVSCEPISSYLGR